MAKHLNYETSTPEEIASHWLTKSRATVSIMRKNHATGLLAPKLEEAYKLYRLKLLQARIDFLNETL